MRSQKKAEPMTNKSFRGIGVLLLIPALCLLSFGSAEAAVVRIDKAKIRLTIAGGQAASGEIKVDNPSEEPLVVKAYLEDWKYLPSADGSKEFSPAGTSELSCAPWVSFAPSGFTIPPFGQQVVRYTVKVPPDAQGGHFAVLFFETNFEQQQGKESVGLMVQVRLGALFYVDVKDTVRRSGRLENFSVSQEPDTGYLVVSGDFNNTGNTDITCGGSFHLMDGQGMVFARGDFNNVYTFPGDKGRLAATWKEPLAKGKYDLVLTLDLGKSLEEAGMGRGPVTVKEAIIEVGGNGRLLKTGELR